MLGGVEHELVCDLIGSALNVLSFTLLGDIPCGGGIHRRSPTGVKWLCMCNTADDECLYIFHKKLERERSYVDIEARRHGSFGALLTEEVGEDG